MLSALFASFHYLALGLGLGAIFMRGRLFRRLKSSPAAGPELSGLFLADNLWGLASLLWIATGLMRAFGGLEKGTQWYLHNHMFYLKMTLFLLVFLLEIWPMITLIQWRIRSKKKQPIQFTAKQITWFGRINHTEMALIILIPFVASMMARGIPAA